MNRLQFHFVIAAAAVCALLPLSASAQAPAPTAAITTTAAVPANASVSATVSATATAVVSTCASGGGAWVGYFGSGASCVDAAGWTSFGAAQKSLASDQVNDVEICGATPVVAHTFGISSRVQGRWRTDRLRATAGAAEAIDCDAQGNVWVAHYDGVSVFDGKSFRTIESRRLGSGSGAKIVQDIAAGPDGKIWVVTANSVARYDGASWKVWEQGAGFEKQEFFGRVAVDSRGAPWVTAIGGVYTFDDGKWWRIELPNIVTIENVAIDAQGRVLVSTANQGLFVYERENWTNYSRENSAISSNHVHAAAVDARGRMWIATEYGLDVVQGSEWLHLRASNSGLRDDDVRELDVEGAGPDLPPPGAELTGTLSGRVTISGSAQADVTVELCVEYVGTSFRGASPCADQPFSHSVMTDAAGRYRFEALPAGGYYVVFRAAGGGWVRLMEPDGFAPERVRVAAGREAGDVNIDLAKAR